MEPTKLITPLGAQEFHTGAYVFFTNSSASESLINRVCIVKAIFDTGGRGFRVGIVGASDAHDLEVSVNDLRFMRFVDKRILDIPKTTTPVIRAKFKYKLGFGFRHSNNNDGDVFYLPGDDLFLVVSEQGTMFIVNSDYLRNKMLLDAHISYKAWARNVQHCETVYKCEQSQDSPKDTSGKPVSKKENTENLLIKGVEETFIKCLGIIRKKDADYAGEIPFENFRTVARLNKMSIARSINVRIGDKYSRLSNLLDKKAQVPSETVEDTIEDMINYLAILKEALRQEA